MSLYRINLDVLSPVPSSIEFSESAYGKALHDIKVMGGELDYWGRGVVELSDDQAAYLTSEYQDGAGLSIVAGPATGTEHEADIRMPNGHYRVSVQF